MTKKRLDAIIDELEKLVAPNSTLLNYAKAAKATFERGHISKDNAILAADSALDLAKKRKTAREKH